MGLHFLQTVIIAYLIWKGSYNPGRCRRPAAQIIAYLIWKGSYNKSADSK